MKKNNNSNIYLSLKNKTKVKEKRVKRGINYGKLRQKYVQPERGEVIVLKWGKGGEMRNC